MSANETSCADDDTLRQLLEGTLSDLQAVLLEEHLTDCADCMSRFEKVAGFESSGDHSETLFGIGTHADLQRQRGEIDSRSLDRLKLAFRTAIPATIGPYRVVRKLGQGAMGEVFECVDERLSRRVALKSIRPMMIDPLLLCHLAREAKLQAGLDHPNIVKLIDMGYSDSIPYLVMELADGGDLKERLAKGRIPHQEVAVLIRDCAQALDHAHERGVLHRDLKPSNILLKKADSSDNHSPGNGSTAGTMSPRIADFGLARFMEGRTHVTQSRSAVGTPAYMAPEQFRAGGHFGRCSDIFALGVILYECLTGRSPFGSDSIAATFRAIEHMTPRLPGDIDDSIPRDLETICMKALEKRPEDRYATAADLAADLDAFANGRSIRARPTPWLVSFSRWCSREPVVAGSLAISLSLMVLLVVGSVRYAWTATELRNQAELSAIEARQSERKANLQRDFALDILNDSTKALLDSFVNLQFIVKDGEKHPGVMNARTMIAGNFARIAERTLAQPDIERLRPGEMIELRYRAATLQHFAGFSDFALPILEDLNRIVDKVDERVRQQESVAIAIISAANLEGILLSDITRNPAAALERLRTTWTYWNRPEIDIGKKMPMASLSLRNLGETFARHLETSGDTKQAESVRQKIAALRKLQILPLGNYSQAPFAGSANRRPKP